MSATAPSAAIDAVRVAAARRCGLPALISDDTVVTWGQLDAHIDEAAHRLAELVRPPMARVAHPVREHPPRVAILLPNGIDFAVTFFAVLRSGMIAVPLNPSYTADEIAHALTDASVALLVADVQSPDRHAGVSARSGSPLAGDTHQPVVSPRLLTGQGAVDDRRMDFAPVRGDAPAVLLYTSGTSGRPKAAMLSHTALAANQAQLAQIRPPLISAEDVVLLAMPLFHAYGLNTGLGAVAHHGACGVLVDRFDASASLALIARHRVTVAVGVPSMYAAWSRRAEAADALTSVRVPVCGAAPLDPAVAARFQAVTGKNIVVGYGLTETAPVLTTTAVSDVTKVGTIGRPLPGVELLLRSADGRQLWLDGGTAGTTDIGPVEGTGRGRGAGRAGRADASLPTAARSSGMDPGEIVVRGTNLFSGYWPDGHGGPDPDGWWATGDIAYADDDGDLFLVDRIGELILVNGFNVYPAEIERVLDSHPGVAEAAVVAEPHPDSGQTPRAYVVPAIEPAPAVAELRAYCATRLARFKLPSRIDLVPELPHSAIGKVRKSQLRAQSS